mmetsp:Transcript_19757/g.36787  ORF Transcript_19757/g.36787 Transcript_19757/m.36787 type:complete len:233 (+) Transcript_19757:141-839(+)
MLQPSHQPLCTVRKRLVVALWIWTASPHRSPLCEGSLSVAAVVSGVMVLCFSAWDLLRRRGYNADSILLRRAGAGEALAGALLFRRSDSRARREVEMCGGVTGMNRTAGKLLHSLRIATPPTSATPKQVRLGERPASSWVMALPCMMRLPPLLSMAGRSADRPSLGLMSKSKSLLFVSTGSESSTNCWSQGSQGAGMAMSETTESPGISSLSSGMWSSSTGTSEVSRSSKTR